MPFVVGLVRPDQGAGARRGDRKRHTRADSGRTHSCSDAYLGDDYLLESAVESQAVRGCLCGGKESGMIRLEGVVAGYGGGNVLQGVDP